MTPSSTRQHDTTPGKKSLPWLVSAFVLVSVLAELWVGLSDKGDTEIAPIALSPGKLRDFNLLLVSIDTLRADRVGCYGHAAAETPTLDALAAQGVRCAQAVTSVPLTLPAHTSLLTGLNPQNHGARANVIFSVPDRVRTLAEILQERGYRTAAVISAFVLDRRFGLAQGFQHYADDLTTDGRTQAFGYRERLAEDTNRHVQAWLDQHGRERFFLWVHYFDPHFPYAPPKPFADRHAGRPYDGEIAYADAQLGQLLAAIDRMGVRDRTLVVVVGDHGEALGEHQELTHGLLVYDATLLVPMIFSGPSPLPQGVVLNRQVGLIDVMPTVLDMLGVPIPTGLDGTSLLQPLPEGPRAIYVESLWPKVMHNWSPLAGIRRDDVKFIHAPRPELYDLQADPNELNNLFAQRPELAAELHQQLRELAGEDPELLGAVSGNLPVDESTRNKLAALGYVVATSAPTTTAAPPDPKDMMGHWARSQRATELANAGRFAEAIAVLEPFVHHNPRDIRALSMLAECYLNLGRYPDAAETFARYASVSRRKAEPLAGLGLATVHLGKLDEAEKALQASLQDDSQNPAAFFGLGLVAFHRGQDAEAMALFKKCIAAGHGTQTAPAYHNIGALHLRAGRKAEARAAFEQALKLDSHHVKAAQALAKMLRAENRLDDAIRVLHHALGMRADPDARTQLGRLLVAQDKASAAVAQFRLALQHRPDHAGAHYELGLVLRSLGQTDKAVEHLSKVLELNAKSMSARFHLGVTLGQTGKLDQARAHLEQVVKSAPRWAPGHYNLGVVLAKQERFADAQRAFTQAVKLDAKNPRAHNALGQVLLELGRRDEAIAAFNESLKLAPDFKPARENLRRAETQPAKG